MQGLDAGYTGLKTITALGCHPALETAMVNSVVAIFQLGIETFMQGPSAVREDLYHAARHGCMTL